nr:hypothetical protein [Roseovarius carneus]
MLRELCQFAVGLHIARTPPAFEIGGVRGANALLKGESAEFEGEVAIMCACATLEGAGVVFRAAPIISRPLRETCRTSGNRI